MPNQHKNPFLGWNPPAEVSARARSEAKERGVPLSVVLTEALVEHLDRQGAKRQEPPPLAAAEDVPRL